MLAVSRSALQSPDYTPRRTKTVNQDSPVLKNCQTAPPDLPDHLLFQALDFQVAQAHAQLKATHGFLPKDHCEGTQLAFKIFEAVKAGAIKIAQQRGLSADYHPEKFHLIDSSEVNAFVFAYYSDVYLERGMLGALARYCRHKGVELTEELIGSVIAHEMAHILQSSATRGLPIADRLSPDERVRVIAFKRNAEIDADRTALLILDAAGYSGSELVKVLEFLKEITQYSTVQAVALYHPHPCLLYTSPSPRD